MTGVEGLGRRVLAGAVSPQARALASDLDHLGMQVTPENVLAARNVLRGEAKRLGDLLRQHEYRLHVVPHAGDPVSQAAAPLFNEKIEALKAQCRAYIDALDRAGLALEQTAREYGHSERQIKDSFRSYTDGLRPEWARQTQQRDDVQALPEPMRSVVQPGPPSPPPSLFPPAAPGGPR